MKKVILIFMVSILACDFEQNVREYKTYEDAKLDNLFEKGWIPKELIYESMSNIIVKSNLDSNTCFFAYNLSSKDLEKIKGKIASGQLKYKEPERIEIPKSEIKHIDKLGKYSFVLLNKNDTIHIAIDNNEDRFYGWY